MAMLTGVVALLLVGATAVQFDSKALSEKCAAGNLSACTELAIAHLTGEGARADPVLAVRLATDACARGEKLACGVTLLSTDQSGAVERFLEACAEGGPVVSCRLAKEGLAKGVLLGERQTELLALFDQSCARSEQAACGAKGLLLSNGSSDIRDVPAAVEKFDQACLSGGAFFCREAGSLARDPARAKERFAKACDLGDAEACGIARSLLELERPTSSSTARKVAEIACAGGDSVACLQFAKLQMPLDRHIGSVQQEKVSPLLTRLCKSRVTDACSGLAALEMPREGDGTSQAAAILKACDEGSAYSCSLLVSLAIKQERLKSRPERTAEFAARGCQGGDSFACLARGFFLFTGYGVQPDAAEGLKVLLRGCELGSAHACDGAAAILATGAGVETNAEMARSLMERTAFLDDDFRRKTPQSLERLYDITFRTEPEIETGSATAEHVVSFSSSPPGAQVLLDGGKICDKTPCKRRIAAGSHSVLLRTPGHRWVSLQLEAKAGAAVAATLPPAYGWLSIQPTPARVALQIDGEVRFAHPAPIRVAAGRGEVAVADPCFKAATHGYTLKAGERAALRVSAEPRLAKLRVIADDKNGDAIEGSVLVDGVKMGVTGATLDVPLCSRTVKVVGRNVDLAGSVALKEDAVTELSLPLPSWETWPKGMTGVNSSTSFDVSAFWLDETEVTVLDYAKCVSAGVCTLPKATWPCNWTQPDRLRHPINCVDLGQAGTFCKWAGKRLPTRAEWIHAAQGGRQATRFPWGDSSPGNRTCWGPTSGGSTCEVGTHEDLGTDLQGAHDLRGNVAEWTSTKSRGDAQFEVCGGGDYLTVLENDLADRAVKIFSPNAQIPTLGFRCAKDSK